MAVAAALILTLKVPEWHRDFLWNKVSPAVYKIGNPAGRLGVGGTGFSVIYKKKTYIVTNRHVCWSAGAGGKIRVRFPYGDMDVNFVVDNDYDLCIASIPGGPGLSLSKNANFNDPIFVVGYPGLLLKRISEGFIGERLLVDVEGHSARSVAISNHIAPGSSGSPVVNLWGNVVAVAYAGSSYTNLAVDVSHLRRFLEREPK